MRETSVVPPMALLLFGGELDVHHDSGYILLDSWLKVRCPAVLERRDSVHALMLRRDASARVSVVWF